ncbi:hypothetical protein K443DRAFT_115240, partial [Laccaria amethystina LaAM-08-1]
PYLEVCTGHVNSAPTLSTTVYNIPYKHYSNIVSNSVHYVASFFPDFLAIFALITISGNVHRPCR